MPAAKHSVPRSTAGNRLLMCGSQTNRTTKRFLGWLVMLYTFQSLTVCWRRTKGFPPVLPTGPRWWRIWSPERQRIQRKAVGVRLLPGHPDPERWIVGPLWLSWDARLCLLFLQNSVGTTNWRTWCFVCNGVYLTGIFFNFPLPTLHLPLRKVTFQMRGWNRRAWPTYYRKWATLMSF